MPLLHVAHRKRKRNVFIPPIHEIVRFIDGDLSTPKLPGLPIYHAARCRTAAGKIQSAVRLHGVFCLCLHRRVNVKLLRTKLHGIGGFVSRNIAPVYTDALLALFLPCVKIPLSARVKGVDQRSGKVNRNRHDPKRRIKRNPNPIGLACLHVSGGKPSGKQRSRGVRTGSTDTDNERSDNFKHGGSVGWLSVITHELTRLQLLFVLQPFEESVN